MEENMVRCEICGELYNEYMDHICPDVSGDDEE
jgi:recombinational DNA repair protein RecR